MIEKQIILMPANVHVVKAKIMELVMSRKVDINTMTLREIGNMIGISEEKPQQVKHHLEQLVSMGTLEKRGGTYFFDHDGYGQLINNAVLKIKK